MASNQHRNLTGEQLHNPKGFDGASPSTTLIKNAAGEIEWVSNSNFDNALDYVSPQSAPPTEVQDDIYLLDDTGVVYDIDTIAWQSGNTIRYTFNGTPNLSAITAGDYLVTSGNGNAVNDGTFIISAVDDGLDYIEITNALRSDATDDEASDAVGTAYYTLGEWDGASKGSHIKFDGTNWNSVNAQDGAICYDETSSSHRIYDAANTNWDTSLSTAAGISGSGTADYVARFTPDGSTLGNSVIQDNGSTVGINTSPLAETDLTTSRTSAASTASANIVTSISGSNTNTTKGIDITASNTSSGTVWGTQADISTSGTSNLVGHEVLIDTSGSGTITANAAYYVNQLDAGGTTTVSNAYGFLSDGVGGAGTTTNAYHVYLTAHSSGTNKYGIYQAGASDENFFAGDTTIGQLKFDASQTVGAGQDNYVLTYDNATGKISLEASAGGGGGGLTIGDAITGGTASRILLEDSSNNLWENDHLKFIYSGTAPNDTMALVVEGYGIKSDTIQAINHPFPTTYYTKIGNSGKIEGAHNGTKWSMESDGTYNYYRSVTAHPCIFQTSNGTYTQLWLDANSNKVKIGAFVAPSATLDVRGAGTGSGTSALKVENSGSTTTLEAKDNGEVSLGNYTFDSSAAVGVGQDNYVLTYDNATGKIGLEAASGGGGSLWTDNSNRLTNDTYGITELNTGTANTYNGTSYQVGNLTVGNANTYNTNGAQKSIVVGDSNSISTISQAFNFVAIGASNTIRGGFNNLIVGSNHTIEGDKNTISGDNIDIYGDENIGLGADHTIGQTATPINNSTAIGTGHTLYGADQIAIGKGVNATFGTTANFPAIFFGLFSNQRPTAGFFADPLLTNSALNLSLGGSEAMRGGFGISNGAGGGILQFHNFGGTATSEPTALIADTAKIWAWDRTSGKMGIKIEAEDGTNHFFSDFSAIGGDQTVATANKTLTVAGTGTGSGTSSLVAENSAGTANLEVRDDGVVIAANLPTSSAGLPTGALWNNSGVINIV